MRETFEKAARAVMDRLSLVLSEDALAIGGGTVPAPAVSMGIPVNRKNYLVWVDPLPRQQSTDGSASNHEARNEFTVSAYLIATHSDRDAALSYVQRWLDFAYHGILADATLCKAVDSAVPRVGESGYDPTPDKKWVVAAELQVRCSFFMSCPSELREYVNAHRDV